MPWADHFTPTLQVGSLSHREVANYLVQDAFAETCRSQGRTWVFRGQLLHVPLAEAAWIYTMFTSLTDPTPSKGVSIRICFSPPQKNKIRPKE